jgi:hypothetical protein
MLFYFQTKRTGVNKVKTLIMLVGGAELHGIKPEVRTDNLEEVVKYIESISVLELKQLVRALEQRVGVTSGELMPIPKKKRRAAVKVLGGKYRPPVTAKKGPRLAPK